jgi:serine/threonine-protein kinase PpkA
LDLLPYKSKVLNLTQEDWHSRSPTQQRQFLYELGEKLRAYEEYNADQRKWRDLGSADPGLQVFPVPLELLP